MNIGLRKFTAGEHLIVASLLVFALTGIAADVTVPDAVRLRGAGHPGAATILGWLPLPVLVAGLLTLIPRTGNASQYAMFRAAGKLPLLARYLVVGLVFCGIETIKVLAGK